MQGNSVALGFLFSPFSRILVPTGTYLETTSLKINTPPCGKLQDPPDPLGQAR